MQSQNSNSMKKMDPRSTSAVIVKKSQNTGSRFTNPIKQQGPESAMFILRIQVLVVLKPAHALNAWDCYFLVVLAKTKIKWRIFSDTPPHLDL
jgi:hypothetical protein